MITNRDTLMTRTRGLQLEPGALPVPIPDTKLKSPPKSALHFNIYHGTCADPWCSTRAVLVCHSVRTFTIFMRDTCGDSHTERVHSVVAYFSRVSTEHNRDDKKGNGGDDAQEGREHQVRLICSYFTRSII